MVSGGSHSASPVEGEFVTVRGRPWLVDGVNDVDAGLRTLSLSCIADDANGEALEVLWDAEVGASVIDDTGWQSVGLGGPDSPEVLAAHVRALRWKSATAADRELLQAPFPAGIRSTPISCCLSASAAPSAREPLIA